VVPSSPDRVDRDTARRRGNPIAGLLHLALGDSAAGSLRAACRFHGLSGTGFSIPDDLSHGPLDDGRVRMHYMRACHRGYDDWTFDAADAFAPWRKVVEWMEREQPKAVVLWSGDNVSEATFLAMACWQLRQRSESVLRVAIPERYGPPYVAFHQPRELAELFSTHHELTDAERVTLSEDFERIRSQSGLLRRWEDGRIIGVAVDHYDRLLLTSCASTWIPAQRVVGAAMARCDPHNLMSDLFFASRLQILIDAGSVEANAVRTRLGEYAVRLAQS
jgi:hypothetical protein